MINKKNYQHLIKKTIIHIFIGINLLKKNIMENLKATYIGKETAERFKSYCKNNGLMMNFTLDRILVEWLDKKEEK